MKELQNLHTHTTFCDGADTPEEMIQAALEKGFTSIGFSEHSYMHCSAAYARLGDKTEVYKKEVALMKEKYRGKIQVFCGLEADRYTKIDLSGFDYLIGSVHYLLCGNECVTFDRGEKETEAYIDRYFGGDGIAFAEAYYKTLATLPELGKIDIIGHYDLITKHSERRTFFDTAGKAYLDAAMAAAEALAGKIPYFEVNTGCISRGYRANPYPAVPVLKELKRLGFGAVITSDCHNKNWLDCGFDRAEQLLKDCGFEEKFILTENGFAPVSL